MKYCVTIGQLLRLPLHLSLYYMWQCCKFGVGVAVVYFGQSSAHALRPPYTLASAHEQLATLSGLVSWRHLHQRLPALLGRFSLAGILGGSEVELTLNMPITCDAGITVAHARLCLQMGRDKLFFGKALLGKCLNFLEVCSTGQVCTVRISPHSVYRPDLTIPV